MKRIIKYIILFFIIIYIILVIINPFKYEYNYILLDNYFVSKKTGITFSNIEKSYIKNNIDKYKIIAINDYRTKQRVVYIILFGIALFSLISILEIKNNERS